MQQLSDAQVQQFAEQLEALLEQIRQVVVGQDTVIRQTLVALVAGGHVLIEGLPGLGKTLLVRSIAEAVGGRFARVQFTPDLMPADIAGHAMFDPKSESFHIRRGPVFCNFLLGDEINRAPAKTQAALLEAMQEAQVTIEGQSFPLSPPFLVMATQNPIEQEGTYPLPQAQLDRFLLNVTIEYPSHEEEIALVERVTTDRVGDQLNLEPVQQVLSVEQVHQLQRAAAGVHVDPTITDYVVRLVRATRDWHGVEIGAGPRASIALLRAARAQAILNGNPFVTPDDVQAILLPALRHRVQLAAALEIEGRRIDEVLQAIVDSVEAPRR
jgi:MoxR-like ATPase